MESAALLQAVSGMVYMSTVTAVAIRLLLLARRSGERPELLLGISLLVGGTFGASLEAAGHMSRLEAPAEVVGTMLLAGKVCGLVALACQSLFIWQVFRRDASWAPYLIAAYVGLALATFVGFGMHGTFRNAEVPLALFWPELLARTAGSVWLVFEGVHYHLMMRKRVAIGLGDPVVSNRFLLWAMAGAFSILMMLTAIPAALDPGRVHPLMAFVGVAFAVLGVAFSVAYALVFFPPAAYERWIQARASSAPA